MNSGVMNGGLMNNRHDVRPAFVGLSDWDVDKLFAEIPTPAYVLDEKMLRHNGEVLAGVAERTGCKVLLAQKAFSNFDMYPVLAPYLAGTEASGLYEARLGKEEMPEGEVHVFCGAYREDEFEELLQYADHIVFNSPAQLLKFAPAAKAAGKQVGLRINPECSTQEGHAIYDPCAPGSRLGTTSAQWDTARREHPELPSYLDGLHFHTLCEQDSDALEITMRAVEERFGDLLPGLKWLNMGGGHHITRPDYDIPRLERILHRVREHWGLQAYLEPGEACALNAGYLVTRVLDVLQNGDVNLAILDMSAACHTPDVLEMPYRPPLYGASVANDEEDVYNAEVLRDTEKEHGTTVNENQGAEQCGIKIRLGGPTCLAGDVIGDYYFSKSLVSGDLLVFGDMAIYTTCKNNTFNGMPLPSIYAMKADGSFRLLKKFGYQDFKNRLGSGE